MSILSHLKAKERAIKDFLRRYKDGNWTVRDRKGHWGIL